MRRMCEMNTKEQSCEKNKEHGRAIAPKRFKFLYRTINHHAFNHVGNQCFIAKIEDEDDDGSVFLLHHELVQVLYK